MQRYELLRNQKKIIGWGITAGRGWGGRNRPPREKERLVEIGHLGERNGWPKSATLGKGTVGRNRPPLEKERLAEIGHLGERNGWPKSATWGKGTVGRNRPPRGKERLVEIGHLGKRTVGRNRPPWEKERLAEIGHLGERNGWPKSATLGKGTVGRNRPTRLFQDGGFAGEGAELGGEGVEVVEAAVVAVGRDASNRGHRVEVPWGEDEQ